MTHTLARLALGLWVGAVACVSFVVAPRVFGFLDDPPHAGELMGPIFKTVDIYGVGAAALFAVLARAHRFRLGLALLLGIVAAVNAFILAPRILEGDAESLHRVATALWGTILVGGVALFLLGPVSPRRAS